MSEIFPTKIRERMTELSGELKVLSRKPGIQFPEFRGTVPETYQEQHRDNFLGRLPHYEAVVMGAVIGDQVFGEKGEYTFALPEVEEFRDAVYTDSRIDEMATKYGFHLWPVFVKHHDGCSVFPKPQLKEFPLSYVGKEISLNNVEGEYSVSGLSALEVLKMAGLYKKKEGREISSSGINYERRGTDHEGKIVPFFNHASLLGTCRDGERGIYSISPSGWNGIVALKKTKKIDLRQYVSTKKLAQARGLGGSVLSGEVDGNVGPIDPKILEKIKAGGWTNRK